MKHLYGFIGFVVVILLSYFAVPTLFNPGYFPMHDDTQVTRVFEMTSALQDGMFPVRWAKDLGYGYGYPIFNFYAPLSYYVGSFINLAGSDALTATKLMIVLGVIFAGMTMYLLARSFWGVTGGVVSAVFYVFAPYHALNVFVRGAVAETWAYAFVPLAFFGLWKVYTDRTWRYVIIGSFGFAGIVLSHNLTAMMVLPYYFVLLCLLVLFSLRSGKNMSWLLLSATAVIALVLSAFYWVPAIAEMGYTNVASQIGGGSMYVDHFVCPSQLWESMWGFGGSMPGCVDGMSFKIGKIHVLISLIALIVGLVFIKSDTGKKNAVIIAFVGLISVIFLMLSYSQFLWDILSPMSYFQFPWRFLLLASFFSSFLAGVIPYSVAQKNGQGKQFIFLSVLIGIVLIGAVMYLNVKLFVPQTVNAKTDSDYTNKGVINWEISKISDEYMPKKFVKPKKEKDVVKNKITSIESLPIITVTTDTTNRLEASVRSNKPVRLLLNIAYFPAWKVFVDNKMTEFDVEKNGIALAVPAGEHTVSAVFTETNIEKTANWISLAGIGVLFIGIIAAWKIKKL